MIINRGQQTQQKALAHKTSERGGEEVRKWTDVINYFPGCVFHGVVVPLLAPLASANSTGI